MFLTFIASESLKLSYTLNYVIKRANELSRFAFEVRQKFEAFEAFEPFRACVESQLFYKVW